MSATLAILVDALPGDSLDEVAVAMDDMARRLGLVVRMASFNGVILVAHPDGSADTLIQAYNRAVASDRSVRVATSR